MNWSDGTPRSTGNAFTTPEPTKLRNTSVTKTMRVNRWIAPAQNKQASADKTAKLKGKP